MAMTRAAAAAAAPNLHSEHEDDASFSLQEERYLREQRTLLQWNGSVHRLLERRRHTRVSRIHNINVAETFFVNI